MPNGPGQDFVDDLKNAFSWNGVKDTLSGAANRASNALSGKSSTDSTPPDSSDTSWHDAQVKAANASFAKQNAKPVSKTPAPAPKTPKPEPKTAAPKAAPIKGSFKTGTDRVPETGNYKLHKDEAVLKKEDAEKLREAKVKKNHMEGVAEELSGKSEKKPKEIEHIKTKKAKSGGYVHTHVHTHPEDHPDETHVSADQDAMASHMLEHMGEPNPGEAEADSGQSGIPTLGAGAGATAGTPPTAV